MELYYKDSNTTLYSGDMNDVNSVVMDNSIDCIITDPPYELGFMGKSWDSSGIAFQKETWKHCFDVLKPGGHLLAFGGSRTFHRIACAIEDAGFEIRDTIMWVYGSGFPKSMNIGIGIDKKLGYKSTIGNVKRGHEDFIGRSTTGDTAGFNRKYTREQQEAYHYEKIPTSNVAKQWQGWGTQLKPAYEPIIVARKPFNGSLVDNVITYGVGGINIDGCRIGAEQRTYKGAGKSNQKIDSHTKGDTGIGMLDGSGKDKEFTVNGRFPSNLILTYDETDEEEVIGGFPIGGKNGSIAKPYKMNNQVYGDYGYCNTWDAYDDSGSASRYFYCAKASKRDRDEGLHEFFEKTKVFNGKSKESSKNIKDVEKRFTTALKNYHPTVKPTSLMQYLIRLVAPKGATILDPFMGSGSTGKALMYENNDRGADYKFIGVELTDEYLPIAKARILFAKGDKEPVLDTVENETTNKVQEDTKPLVERFDFGV